MKYLFLLLLIPATLVAQEKINAINPNSVELMQVLNAEFIEIVNRKRAETDLAPLVASDSLNKLATHYVGLFVGIGEGDLPSNATDHYFIGYGTKGGQVDVSDVVRTHWVTSGNGLFPGIKPHYTQIGIGSILKKEDLLNYVIYK